MTVALRHRAMTEAEFLAWAEPLEERCEYDGTGPVAMVGNTVAHGRILVRLLVRLEAELDGTAFCALGSDMFTRVSGSLRLPDVQVVVRDLDMQTRVSAEPVVVFEILSRSTARLDRGIKAREYWGTPSIQHYVMLEQDRVSAEILSRGPSGWLSCPVGPGGMIALPALGIGLPLAELYDGLRMPQPGGGA